MKIGIYRKINRLSSASEVIELEKELVDRFGRIPKPVKNLLTESEIRIAAQNYHIRSMKRVNGTIIFFFDTMKIAEPLFKKKKKQVKVLDSNELHLRLPRGKMTPEDLADFVKDLLNS